MSNLFDSNLNQKVVTIPQDANRDDWLEFIATIFNCPDLVKLGVPQKSWKQNQFKAFIQELAIGDNFDKIPLNEYWTNEVDSGRDPSFVIAAFINLTIAYYYNSKRWRCGACHSQSKYHTFNAEAFKNPQNKAMGGDHCPILKHPGEDLLDFLPESEQTKFDFKATHWARHILVEYAKNNGFIVDEPEPQESKSKSKSKSKSNLIPLNKNYYNFYKPTKKNKNAPKPKFDDFDESTKLNVQKAQEFQNLKNQQQQQRQKRQVLDDDDDEEEEEEEEEEVELQKVELQKEQKFKLAKKVEMQNLIAQVQRQKNQKKQIKEILVQQQEQAKMMSAMFEELKKQHEYFALLQQHQQVQHQQNPQDDHKDDKKKILLDLQKQHQQHQQLNKSF